jgi:hypothetical protein
VDNFVTADENKAGRETQSAPSNQDAIIFPPRIQLPITAIVRLMTPSGKLDSHLWLVENNPQMHFGERPIRVSPDHSDACAQPKSRAVASMLQADGSKRPGGNFWWASRRIAVTLTTLPVARSCGIPGQFAARALEHSDRVLLRLE